MPPADVAGPANPVVSRTVAANFGFSRLDGSNALHVSGVRGIFFGQSAFATHLLATERNLVASPMIIPRLIELYQAGNFPFDRLVKFYDFAEINRAMDDVRSGKTIKPILRIGEQRG